ncbi:hypothetical protein Hdeb2414_s0001g00039211 [Helianthus debilis subsp. tardiflorus]
MVDRRERWHLHGIAFGTDSITFSKDFSSGFAVFMKDSCLLERISSSSRL